MAIRSDISTLGKNTSIYGLGNILVKVGAFILIPVYTRYLPLTDVGVLALLEMVEQLLIMIAPTVFVTSMWRFLPGEKSAEKRKTYATTYFGIQSAGIIVIAFLFINSSYFLEVLNLPLRFLTFFQILLANIFLVSGTQFILAYFQYEQKPFHYLIISFIQFFGIVILTSGLVIFGKFGLLGVLLGKLIVLLILYLSSLVMIIKKNMLSISLNIYRRQVKYGLPLIVTAFVTPVLSFSDRYFLNMFTSIEEIGIYSIAYKFGMLINMVLVVPLQRSWVPYMFRKGLNEDSNFIFKDILYYYTILSTYIFILISVSGAYLLRVLTTEQYLPGAVFIPWICFAYLISGYRMFFNSGAALKDKTPYLSYVSLITIIVNIILNYFLIKHLGVKGAVYSTVISYLCLASLTYMVNSMVSTIKWDFKRNFLVIIIAVAFVYFSFFFSDFPGSGKLIIPLAPVIVYPFTLYALKLIGKREISGIQALLRKVRGN